MKLGDKDWTKRGEWPEMVIRAEEVIITLLPNPFQLLEYQYGGKVYLIN